jgi:hypothetical protein
MSVYGSSAPGSPPRARSHAVVRAQAAAFERSAQVAGTAACQHSVEPFEGGREVGGDVVDRPMGATRWQADVRPIRGGREARGALPLDELSRIGPWRSIGLGDRHHRTVNGSQTTVRVWKGKVIVRSLSV